MGIPQGPLRKAAVLLASLDKAGAQALLAQMTPAQADRVWAAIAELDNVRDDERRQTIEEFLARRKSSPGADGPSGIELDGELARRLAVGGAATYERTAASSGEPPPFQFLHEAETALLLPLVEREHPQTVAVVVSRLPPRRAAELLARLPPTTQADVVRRLVDLEDTDPEILREIENGLKSLVSQQLRTVHRRRAGTAAVSAILGAADGADRRDILANLARHDAQLVRRLEQIPHGQPAMPQGEPTTSVGKPATSAAVKNGRTASIRGLAPPAQVNAPAQVNPPAQAVLAAPARVHIQFDDVAKLGDGELKAVLGRADPEVTLLALSGAPRELVERILAQLPTGQARTVEQRMERLGPLSLRDVDRAQRELARLAAELVAAGRIALPVSGRRLAAVA